MKKIDIISFKAEKELAELLKCLPNRSEFIRNALISALGITCPICQGKGFFSPTQLKHWEKFMKSHSLKDCKVCEGTHLVCDN